MSSDNDLAISVRGLSKSYTIRHNVEKPTTLAESIVQRVRHPFRQSTRETFWALKDVSFDVKRGEVVGIIGRNGAGKSTLLKILSRITAPTEGEIVLNGRVGSLLEVGTGFHQELTGRENIFLNGAILGMTRAEIRRQFDAIVDFAGVEQFLDTPVKRYSSGMYVRLAFAVAAHLRSEILIVDEVLAVGDSQFQKRCLGKMSEIAALGRTILFVSHNQSAVTRLCSRGILLSAGQVLTDGPSQLAVAKYLDAISEHSQIRRSHTDHLPVRIDSVRVMNAGEVCFGSDLEIEALCSAKEHTAAALEVVVRDQDGHPIVFLPSGIRFGRTFELNTAGVNRIVCRVHELPLAEGVYHLDVMLTLSGAGVLDQIQSAASFQVLSADPTGSGRAFSQATRQGCVHLSASFEFSVEPAGARASSGPKMESA